MNDLPAPRLVRAAAGLAAVFFALPLVGILARVPWADAVAIVASREVFTALVLSVFVSLCATFIALAFGVPLAFVLARARGRSGTLLRAIVTLPLVLPPVVGGVGLLFALGRRGVLGDALAAIGVVLPFSTAGAVVAATFVSAPFLVLTVEAGFARVDPRHVDAARVLGAGPLLLARTVILPALRPALLAGTGLCFARALGEFGATITFAGALDGRTRTLPLLVYRMLTEGPAAAALVSLLLLLVAAGALLALRAWPGSR